MTSAYLSVRLRLAVRPERPTRHICPDRYALVRQTASMNGPIDSTGLVAGSRPIESYALIGDRRTAALVGTDGSIDWLCFPRFDSPACLAALVGERTNGHWQLQPVEDYTVSRRYVGDSCALETTFVTESGQARLVDVMPDHDEHADIVRVLQGDEGTVRFRHIWRVRPDYGRIRPWVQRLTLESGEKVISAVAGPDRIVLRGTRLPRASDHVHADEFDLAAGDELTFTMAWLPSHADVETVHEMGRVSERVRATIAEQEEWAARCTADVPQAAAVRRSLLTLRLMTDGDTGGIVAAPTTSLPEDPGGVRNWDYRYCWLRDAALTVAALVRAGYVDEADLWRGWLLRAVAGDPQDLQIMYAVDGARRLTEYEIPELRGYADSRPVRVGNAASGQLQHDVLGEVMDALDTQRRAEGRADKNAWAIQCALVDDLATHWDRPDNGLWEIRGEPQHFVHSRVMEWVAFDRAVAGVEELGLPGPVEKWREVRDRIRAEVLDRGFDTERNSFVQHYGTSEVDASLLLLSACGFVAGDDPRMLGTIAAVEHDLLRNGLLLRYHTATGVDGLAGDEHPFLACSFWLVEAYARAGRVDEAGALFDRLVGLTNDVGLLSEEYDPAGDRMIGNFPQAFSHLALVRAALTLAELSADS